MSELDAELSILHRRVLQLIYLVAEALAKATEALLSGEPGTAQTIVDADAVIDELTHDLDRVVWKHLESGNYAGGDLRYLVAVLLMLPELERSADLAEHIAQRAVGNVGPEMTPVSRGVVQRMSEVGVEMWHSLADAYVERRSDGEWLDEADEELDILHGRLTEEVARQTMTASVSAQVTLLGRFYERLGDHAVNLARRIGTLPAP